MRYTPIDPTLFVENRKRLAAELPAGSLAVLHANDVMPSNADGVLPFRQNTDLFYLTGVDQEETVLVLYPDAPDEKLREVLFVRETNEKLETWEGRKLNRDRASEISGIQTVRWTSQFDSLFKSLMLTAEVVWLNGEQRLRFASPVQSRNARFIEKSQADYPLHKYERLDPLLGRLRAVKAPAEIECIREAGAITEKGFRRALGAIRPGAAEYEIEAEFTAELLRNRSRWCSFAPIVASGPNACVLHYVENSATCKDGDLVLMDLGVEYAHYNSDITRTVPVNGRFTKRQRQVYEAVLGLLRTAQPLLRPGVELKAYEEEMRGHMDEALVGLGLLTRKDIEDQDPEKPARLKYFMHRCSHHLGLDVHDVPLATLPLEPGMVLTVEPGIYIREEGLGVRLEDDVWVGETENVNLTSSIPLEPDEIEALMNS